MKTISPIKLASAKRQTVDQVKEGVATFSAHACSQCFDHFPLPLLVLNEQRQAVFSNQYFMKMLGINKADDFQGKRPGEILRCIYAGDGPGGCGTSGYCSECGAIHAVLESINTDSLSTRDCHLLQSIDGQKRALDLRVHASPFSLNNTKYYVVTIMDIADEKEREAMERIFFHDILNSAGSAKSLVDALEPDGTIDLQEPWRLLGMALYGLVEEIQTYKDLRLAEKGNYQLSSTTIQSFEMVEAIAIEFRSHKLAEGKQITIMPSFESAAIETDYSLLRRILINMLKNALEATRTGGVVQIGSRLENDEVVFEVQNDQVMDQAVQLQIFKRFFSTKGKGRGLGTYSIKLLTENYLDGIASFESREGVGTVFRVSFKKSDEAH